MNVEKVNGLPSLKALLIDGKTYRAFWLYRDTVQIECLFTRKTVGRWGIQLGTTTVAKPLDRTGATYAKILPVFKAEFPGYFDDQNGE